MKSLRWRRSPTMASDWLARNSSSRLMSKFIRKHCWNSTSWTTQHEAQVEEATAGYDDKPQFYIDRLAEGHRDDRRRVLSQGRHSSTQRFQDQRVRESDRRCGLRTERRKPDDRFPWRFAVLQPSIPSRVRLGMQSDPKGPSGNGTSQSEADDSRFVGRSRKATRFKQKWRNTVWFAAKTDWSST